MRERSTFTQSKIPLVARNTFGHIKSENNEISEYSEGDKNALGYISDQLCRMA